MLSSDSLLVQIQQSLMDISALWPQGSGYLNQHENTQTFVCSCFLHLATKGDVNMQNKTHIRTSG